MRRNVIGTILLTILVLGALGTVGFGIYQIGFEQGLVETGTEVVVRGPGVQPGYWGYGGFGAFGVFGLFFRVLFLFLIIGLIARLFFGRRWGGGPYWGRDWHDGHESPMERRLSEWHEKAHDDRTGDRGPDQQT